MKIHPTAIVSEQAQISPDTEIGPYAVIDGEVIIGAHTIIDSHVRIGSRFGTVVIGERNYIQSGAMLGGPPQDWSYDDAQTRLEIGDHNRIGESASLNLGSNKGSGVTRVGSNTFIMAYAHVGHDCRIENEVVLTNLVQLAGHVTIERGAVVGGVVAVSQYTRLGEYSFVAAGALVNKVGLKRAGQGDDETREIDKAIRIILRQGLTIDEALVKIRAECDTNARIEHLVDFINTSDRGIARV